MCYNNCSYESFNPVTGDCACRRGKNPCPEELVYCEKCKVSISEEDYSDSLEATGGKLALCYDCFMEWLDGNATQIMCPYCDTEFESADSDSTECPKCKKTVPL